VRVIFASNAEMSRQHARAYIAQRRADNPRFSVVDIGGAADSWSGADCFVDFHRVEGQDTITGDIHDPAIWKEIAARGFDFCVCSHLLEDIRDPVFVLGKIRDTFRHGYIVVPNKHVEFGSIEPIHYVGYGYHRWIYTLVGGELRVVAKLPLASYIAPKNDLTPRFRPFVPNNRSASTIPHTLYAGPLHWRNRALGPPGNELAFAWEGELNFLVINSDYAGATSHEVHDCIAKNWQREPERSPIL
jgi:hypothetical protein